MTRTLSLGAALAALLSAALAWEGALQRLGITEQDVNKFAQTAIREDYSGEPDIGPARKALRSMSLPDRAAAVRELAPIVKSIVMSPQFERAYDAYLRQSRNAVNHDLKVQDPAAQARAAMAQNPDVAAAARGQAASSMASAFSQMPPDMLKTMFNSDYASWKRKAATPGADQAKYKKLLARGDELKAIADSDPTGFKNGYVVLKSAELGGPDSMEAINAGTSNRQAEDEQRRYEQYKLRAVLEQHLTAFVALARSVDFSAQTTGAAHRFIDPQFERKGSDWKLLYRFGPAPTQAAVQAAEQWLKEL